MSLQRFLEPINPDDPCGPDLFEAMDDPFESYMLEAEDRLPQQFFTPEGRFRVDPSSVKIKAEITKASALLERSRDLRVLAWLAQYCAAARDLATLVECVELMAGLLETYGSQVHPRLTEDEIDRCNALEMLDGGTAMRLPLEFFPIARDRRHGVLNWRRVAIADGRRNPVAEDGEPVDRDVLVAALRSAENTDQVAASHALFVRLKEAMTRIEQACLANEERAFRPNLELVQAHIEQILTLLQGVRPDLAGEEAAEEGDSAGADGAGADGAAGSDVGGVAVAAAEVPASSIRDARHARGALAALEAYFVRHEPSSPSFILVRQARQLQGRPLVEALELLLPSKYDEARIDFSRETGFVLTMERMRALSELEAQDAEEDDSAGADGAGADGAPLSDAARPDATVVANRTEASSVMSALERYFTATEPSSPIPLLLTRARGYLNQNFASILAEMFPAKD